MATFMDARAEPGRYLKEREAEEGGEERLLSFGAILDTTTDRVPQSRIFIFVPDDPGDPMSFEQEREKWADRPHRATGLCAPFCPFLHFLFNVYLVNL